MTVIALFAAAAVMGIVLGVTAETGCRRILVCLVRVAIEALILTMLADQRKVSCIVVERRICPVTRVVALGTFRTKTTVMRLVVAMAIDAFAGRLAMLRVGLMAAFALGLKVLTQQLEIGEMVIECRLVQAEDICIATVVVGMTGSAGFVANVVGPPVKAGTSRCIARDIFMAVEAKFPLVATIETLVARCTVGFNVRVPANNLAGHNQRLNRLSSSSVMKCKG